MIISTMGATVWTISFFFCFHPLKAQEIDYYPPGPMPDRIILNLTTDPAHSMAVTWRCAETVKKGYVQVSKASPHPDLELGARTVDASVQMHASKNNRAHYFSAIIDSLSAGTQYAYRVGDSLRWSEWAHFTTLSTTSADPFSFIYFGDAQNDLKSKWSRSIRGAYSKMPNADFLLHAGDLVNRANNDREWGEWFYCGGWIYRMTPSISTPGNHEYFKHTDDQYLLSGHWRPTFTQPENGPEGLEETAFYLDYKNTRIISFDSPAFYRSKQDSAAQVNWLKKTLRNNPQRWTIVTTHYPMYSTKAGRDNNEMREAIQPLLEKYNVDIVLQGHDHSYGRGTNLPIGKKKANSIDGPMYVVSVSGPKMYDLGLDEWMQRGASNVQLYQLIWIDDRVLRFEAYTVDGKLYDAFQIIKGEKGNKSFYDMAPREVPEFLELPPRYQQNFTEAELKDYRDRFKAYKNRQKNRGK